MHRPEMWGYVQFEEHQLPFKKDPDWDAKCMLMACYYAQSEFKEKHKSYASSMDELKILSSSVRIRLTETGYVASLPGSAGLLTIREDSRLTVVLDEP